MRRRPKLIDVRIVPWEMECDLFGIVCEYDDGETIREMWGSYLETRLAVDIRQGDIVPAVNIKRS
jgi:hypothetical protein